MKATFFRWIRRLLVLALLGIIAGVFTVAGVLYYYSQDLPKIITLDDYHPPQATRVYSADGQVIAVFAKERRALRGLNKIADVLENAVLAAEDADFYEHPGIDWRAIARAALKVARDRRFSQGGSTLTQQVVKTFLLSKEKKISRKIKEAILAMMLEENLTKAEIFTLYLNQIYLGHGSYGVQEAARYYYGKDAQDLDLNEAATLAGIIPSPERYSPIKHPKKAKIRRRYVLDQMVKAGFIDQQQADECASQPLNASRHWDAPKGLAPHFVEHVRRELRDRVGSKLLYTGGLAVHTTLDVRLQEAANEAVVLALQAVDKRQKYHKPLKRGISDWYVSKVYRENRGKAEKPGKIIRGVVISRSEDPPGYNVSVTANVYGIMLDKTLIRYTSGTRPASQMFKRNDIIRVSLQEKRGRDGQRFFQPEFGPSGALVALEPHTRRVVALVGGDPTLAEGNAYNRITQARRQPGSVFKPIVYGAGIEAEVITPASIYPDAPAPFRLWDGSVWSPKNYSGNYLGPIRIRHALKRSINMVAIRVIQDVGVQNVIDFAHRLGITSELAPYLPLALGATALRPIEVVNAYAVFASGGMLGDPIFIDRIEGPAGGTLYTAKVELKRVMEPPAAFVITSLLTSVVQEGTGRRAKKLGVPAAGKTGTTNGPVDVWFSGFTPHLVATVWVGFDDNQELGKGEQGAKTALPMWVKFMQATINEDEPVGSFEPPEGVVSLLIDKETGLRAPDGLEEVDEERPMVDYFIEGTEPKEYATLPGEVTEDSFLLDQFGSMDEELGYDPRASSVGTADPNAQPPNPYLSRPAPLPVYSPEVEPPAPLPAPQPAPVRPPVAEPPTTRPTPQPPTTRPPPIEEEDEEEEEAADPPDEEEPDPPPRGQRRIMRRKKK